MAVRFILQLGLLILAARLGSALFRRWKLSTSLGSLAAGILLGPHVLGGLLGSTALFGAGAGGMTLPDGLSGVVTLAMLVLLFLIGLETDVRLLRRHSLAGALVGLGGTVAALVAGGAVTMLFAPSLYGRAVSGWAPSTLFGAIAVAASSVSLIALTLAGQRRMESPEGRVALSGAAIDNLLAVLLLSAVTGMAMSGREPTALLAVQMLLKTLAAGAVAGVVAVAIARAGNRLAATGSDANGPAVYCVVLALLAGGVFAFLDLAPFLGAYVVGLAFSAAEIRHQVQERLEFVHAALVPPCFALVGTAVDPSLLIQPGVMLFALSFTGIVLLAKGLGSGLPACLAGLNPVGCLRVGVAMLPRGEMALAVVVAALAAGLLSPELLAAVVVLFAVAGVLAPVLMERVFASGGAGTRNGFPSSADVRVTFTFPSHSAAELVMSRLIELFEDEGYYINLLHRREHLYQFTRDASVFSVQNPGLLIVFTCPAQDRDLINTAMLEVAAGMEQSLCELRKPLDAAMLRQRLQADADPAGGAREADPAAMAVLRGALVAGAMQPRLQAADKAGIIAELVDLLRAGGLVRDPDVAVRAVLAREQGLASGLQHGIAIPHARTDAVDRLVCAVGLKPEGVAFDALDGRPARIIVLMLAPQHAAAPQLQFLAAVSQALNDQGRAALLACDTPDDMCAVLSGAPRRGRQASALASLAWQSISLDLRARTKEEALDQLIALCARSGAVVAPDEARAAIFAREQKSVTIIENGVALPHARTTAASRMVCAFGISRSGVAFDATDDQPAHFLAMVLAPPSETTEYTRLIGALARALDTDGRQALLAARSSQEALAILTARGERLR
jgi:mannitol/fructose-specific phosphotransferase system IIA component (Ntr-type)/Kef-type K+ transport system membrane component KefB